MSIARVALLLLMALLLTACASLRLTDTDRDYFWQLQRDDSAGVTNFIQSSQPSLHHE